MTGALGDVQRETGLTGRALAARCHVPPSTLAAAAHGRDVRLGVLQSLAARVPEFDAAAALGRGSTPRPARLEEWRAFRDLTGFVVDEVTVDVEIDSGGDQRVEVRWDGLRVTRGSLHDPVLRTAILGAAVIGAPAAREELAPIAGTAPGTTRRIVRDGVTHVIDLPLDPDVDGASCRRVPHGRPVTALQDPIRPMRHGRPFDRGTSFLLDCCARRLVLRVRFDARARPGGVDVWLWPPSLGVDADHPINRWQDVYPGVPARLGVSLEGVAELVVDHPLPWACHGLGWDAPRAPPAEAGLAWRLEASPSRILPFARALARARTRAGLSRRALARLLSVSPATVVELERGREPQASTVRGVLRALPHLSPWEFLPREVERSRIGADELWARQRDFFGLVSDEEQRRIEIAPDGSVRVRSRTIGLTWSSARRDALRLRLGTTPVFNEVDRELTALRVEKTVDAGEARIRLLAGRQAGSVHELSLASAGSHPTVSFTRTIEAHGMYALTMERFLGDLTTPADRWRSLRRREAGPPLPVETTAIELTTPTRRLELSVRLPAGLRAEEPIAKVIPRAVYPVEDLEDLRPRFHPEGFRFARDDARGVLSLEVERPLVGLRYAVSWLVDGAREQPLRPEDLAASETGA